MSIQNLSSENRVLLYCARASMDKDTAYKLKVTLNDNLDWNYIIKNALRHGISPLLYRNLSRIVDANLIPERIMEHLRGQHYATLTRNMHYYNELNKILRSFKDAGIEVIVLKGAALAETVYQDIGLRQFGDIDILVRREDLQRAKKKMSELGYTQKEVIGGISLDWIEKCGNEIRYYAQDRPDIEIHWNIVPETRFKIEIERMWESALPTKIANADAYILSPRDLLLHLCVHLGMHRFAFLRWFCDISEVLRYCKNDLKWEDIIENANKHKIKTYVYYALYLTKELINAPIPTEVLNSIIPGRFRLKLIGLLITKENILHLKNPQRTTFTVLLSILLIDKIQDIVKYLLKSFFPTKEQLSIIYSIPTRSKKKYFYYLIRPIHIYFRSIKKLR